MIALYTDIDKKSSIKLQITQRIGNIADFATPIPDCRTDYKGSVSILPCRDKFD